MLKWGFLAVFTIVLFLTIPISFGEISSTSQYGSLTVEKEIYVLNPGKTDIIKIFGTINDLQEGELVTMMFTLPDGSPNGAKIPTTKDGYFENYFPIDYNTQLGKYEVTASYAGQMIGSISFIVEEKKFTQEELEEARQTSPKLETPSQPTTTKTPQPITTKTPQPETLPNSLEITLPAGTSVPGCETTNECFVPFEGFVSLGGKVVWKNDDTAAHTVTSGAPSEGPDGIFDSSLFMAGTSFEYTFNKAGTFDYFCMVHPWMVGIVSVGGTASQYEEPEQSIPEPIVAEEIKKETSAFDKPITSAEDFDKRSAECTTYECQQSQMYSKLNYLKQTGQYVDPITESLRKSNEAARQAQYDRQIAMITWAFILIPIIIVGIIVAVVIKKLAKRNKRKKIYAESVTKKKTADFKEKGWEGI